MEVTARRCLSYLSGGHIVGILKDILYEEEKERIANRYRLAIIRIGEVLKVNSSFKPKQKGAILDAMKQAGFDKDELRERGWTFSNHLWNSSGRISIHQSLENLPQLVARNRSNSNTKRSKYERHLISETRFHRTRYVRKWERHINLKLFMSYITLDVTATLCLLSGSMIY